MKLSQYGIDIAAMAAINYVDFEKGISKEPTIGNMEYILKELLLQNVDREQATKLANIASMEVSTLTKYLISMGRELSIDCSQLEDKQVGYIYNFAKSMAAIDPSISPEEKYNDILYSEKILDLFLLQLQGICQKKTRLPQGFVQYALLHLAIASLFVLACFHMPYAFYQILRIVGCGYFALIAYSIINRRQNITINSVIAGMLAILYNPVAPIYLSRDIWMPINIFTAAWMLFVGYKIYKLLLK